MQAVILLAGYGKRLRPLTDRIPKALVEVDGTPLLLNALNHLSGRDIDEVVLVVGDKWEQVQALVGGSYAGMKITYVVNERFRETNNVCSFLLAAPHLHDDVLLLECDLFYRRGLLDTLLERGRDADCAILVSPYDPARMDGTVVHAAPDGHVRSLAVKRAQGPGFDYAGALKTVNIYRFSRAFVCDRLMPMVDAFVRTHGENSYYELVIGALVYFQLDDIRAVTVPPAQWAEIDDLDDLEAARRQFPHA